SATAMKSPLRRPVVTSTRSWVKSGRGRVCDIASSFDGPCGRGYRHRRVAASTSYCTTSVGKGQLPLTLLAHPHVDDDRRSFERVQLAQAPLDEPAVPGVEETGREQHERRRTRRRLRA